MIKNNSQGDRNLSEQVKYLTSYYKYTYKFINPSADRSSKKTAFPSPKQAFLHNLWLKLESIQDQIKDRSSLGFRLFEILNSIIFNLWVKTGRR